MNQDDEKSPWKVPDCSQPKHTNSPIFSTLIFLAVMLLIVAGNIFSNISLESSTFNVEASSEVIPTKNINSNIMIASKKSKRNDNHWEMPNPLTPPKNTTSKDRIAWLCMHLPEFEVFRSTNLSKQFNGRVLKFFNETCEVRFFMTWIAPAQVFGRREFRAVESVFKAHPNGCLMIVSGSMDSPQGDSILKPLLDRGFRVLAATPDFQLLLENTPAKAWFDEIRSCKRDPGRIPLSQNLSNLARLVIIYKYGGVYIDTDFIVMRSFKGLKNSIGAQTVDEQSKNWIRLNNAVLIFEKNHPLVYGFIEEFASTFDGNRWGHNGPYLVSRVAKRVEGEIGKNFTVLSPTAFYPFNWIEIQSLFRKPKSSNETRLSEAELLKLNKESYGMHLWNKKARNLPIEKGSVIDRIISENCVICGETPR
ncbi:PREDICTED: lactosylceramide 4-alpha-galactosyltransferase [Tarenaya hassleriana]|uniref:lactosylceramide 4-alpha-galactosyltransferase n=1 Tax=Tarenaya hassleriana TaxID=28532 RepID=UPI00053C6C8F|nr:PREDICTED: lactosylceramide 4-alpha-galactosyltransferase [Tarenaya hassleriana]